MLDHVHIFHRGGLVVWSKSYVATPSPVNIFIRQFFIDQNYQRPDSLNDSAEIQLGSHSLAWNLSNRFGLVFVVIYQRILQLTYINELLESINTSFISLYSSILQSEFRSSKILDLGSRLSTRGFQTLFRAWDQNFNKILKDVERMAERRRGDPGNHRRAIGLEKVSIRMASEEDVEDKLSSPTKVDKSVLDSETIARNIAALKARKKKQQSSTQNSKNNSRAGSRSGTDTESINNRSNRPINQKKESRRWDDGRITTDEIAEYDFSEQMNCSKNTQKESKPGDLIDLNSMGKINHQGQYEVADYDDDRTKKGSSEKQPSSTIFSKLFSSIPFLQSSNDSLEPITLKKTDLRPILDQIQTQLMRKNVAREISVKVCDRIETDLIGRQLKDRSKASLKKLIYQSLETSLTKVLTPSSSTDLISDIHQKKNQNRGLIRTLERSSDDKEPFVITFVGVNGVGKSTNLSKVAFWLIQNKFRVLVAACDTFRAGAVEQLRIHVRNLGQIQLSNDRSNENEEIKVIDLYEKGYGKDAAGIAKDAIQFAKENRFDVVLIDTAGRMQDNEPLMRSLGKLINVNRPDKILFVGEALVGNEAVDQLSKFDQSLKNFTANESNNGNYNLGGRLSSGECRGVDGIILTKFDTIDDKVGASISMTYITGKPILFVGTGQTYTDLRTLKVNHIVDALIRQ
ncbi:signal recognition particle receptor subunit alpha [Phakopsora pachyrhizi]|nr:signal recognition particle receptor subunit alpha [Phakopsora pachyrhizi]